MKASELNAHILAAGKHACLSVQFNYHNTNVPIVNTLGPRDHVYSAGIKVTLIYYFILYFVLFVLLCFVRYDLAARLSLQIWHST